MNKLSNKTVITLREQLLNWYDAHHRILPWRTSLGVKANPYHVWLSEVMLQQTVVKAVIPYFLKFTHRWPDVHALANAKDEDVMEAWAGLGYYARARNLLKCARIVSVEMGGVFPSDQESLKSLPGIGDYTSAAIAGIAFNQPAIVIDGNVDRVAVRMAAIDKPIKESKADIKKYMTALAGGNDSRPGDFAQAMMDLGAVVCMPTSPSCEMCPWMDHCESYKAGRTSELPIKPVKIKKPQRYGVVLWLEADDGRILLHKRPPEGLLGGMTGLPTTEWSKKTLRKTDIPNHDYLSLQSGDVTIDSSRVVVLDKAVRHIFTHFILHLILVRGRVTDSFLNDLSDDAYYLATREEIADMGLPTVFKKSVSLFLL